MIDMNGISQINHPAGEKEFALKKACEGFEEIMLRELLSEMDKTVPKDPLLKNSAANGIYKSMYTNALSNKIATESSFGIGKLLFDSLKDYVSYKNLPKKINIKPLKAETKFIDKNIKHSKNKEEIINNAVDKASKKYKVPKQLIYGIIKAESGFNPKSISNKGAVGLMQLMPQTALEMGVKHIWNIEENIMGGTKYISSLINRFKNSKMAIAAYNAGPGNVSKYKGIPPFKETQNYVKKVLAYSKEY